MIPACAGMTWDMNVAELIKQKFPNGVTEVPGQKGDALVYVTRESLKKILQTLKTDPDFSFNVLMDLFAVDYLHWEEKSQRFELIYNLFSTTKNHRLFVKTAIPEKDASVDSVVSVWPAANWLEREVWDMFGVSFRGHPNLKRILMYEEFKGHALRKDYAYNKRQPLIGPMN